MKITMRDGVVITEKWNKDEKTYEYYLGNEFIFGAYDRFDQDALQNLYYIGYFEPEKMQKLGKNIKPVKIYSPKVKASLKYNGKNTKQVKLSLNLRTDADILDWLQGIDNVQGYIKKLIRNDMP